MLNFKISKVLRVDITNWNEECSENIVKSLEDLQKPIQSEYEEYI